MTLLTAWLVLVGIALLGVPLGRWRRDIEARHSAEARADRAERRADLERERAEVAEQAARDWAAVADERAMDLVEHRHRCLGEMVPNDSGVVR